MHTLVKDLHTLFLLGVSPRDGEVVLAQRVPKGKHLVANAQRHGVGHGKGFEHGLQRTHGVRILHHNHRYVLDGLDTQHAGGELRVDPKIARNHDLHVFVERHHVLVGVDPDLRGGLEDDGPTAQLCRLGHGYVGHTASGRALGPVAGRHLHTTGFDLHHTPPSRFHNALGDVRTDTHHDVRRNLVQVARGAVGEPGGAERWSGGRILTVAVPLQHGMGHRMRVTWVHTSLSPGMGHGNA